MEMYVEIVFCLVIYSLTSASSRRRFAARLTRLPLARFVRDEHFISTTVKENIQWIQQLQD
jgi:hypothetical protein